MPRRLRHHPRRHRRSRRHRRTTRLPRRRIVTTSDGNSDTIPYCPDNDGDGIADAPPTAAEITATCPPPPATNLAISPARYGITGLDTWYWHDGPTDLSTATTIRGYAVSCTLTATTFHLDTGDPHAAEFDRNRHHTSDTNGHEGPDSPLQHLYERTGTYPVQLTITWTRTTSPSTGTATLDGQTDSRDYQVRQVRAGMTTPDR